MLDGSLEEAAKELASKGLVVGFVVVVEYIDSDGVRWLDGRDMGTSWQVKGYLTDALDDLAMAERED